MATRTISDTGGNWNSTATWVEGVVPVLGDAVVATATSGQLTINVTTAACTSINFTNYTNTLTISSGQTLTVSGNVTFVAAMTIAGTGTLAINATATLTSAGKTLTGNLTLAGTSQTYTLADSWTVSGNLILSGVTALTINGLFNLNIGGNLTQTTTAITSGTTTIVLNGTGTWSNSSTGPLRNNLTINTAGTITISGTVYYNTGTLTYTAGTVTTTGSTLRIENANATLNVNGINWNNILLSANASTAITITLSSNLAATGTLTAGAGSAGTITINNNTLFVASISITSVGTVTGTTVITLNSTGTWSHTSTGVLRNSLTINTLGTITISGTVYYNTGTLTYTAGTVVTTGSTLNCTLGTTFNCANMDGVTTNKWNNVILAGSTHTLSANLNIGGNLTLQSTAVIVNGLFNINVAGNLATNIGTSGTSTIVLNGTGTWSQSGTANNSINITINTLGTITISGNIYYAGGTLTYTAGTVTTTGSTIIHQNANTTLNTNGITWNNVTIQGTGTYTLSSNMACTNINLGSGANTVINGNKIFVSGNLTATVSATVSGTTTIEMNGTGTYSHTSTGALRNNLIFNTVGTITISGTIYYNTGTLTYTAGTIITTGSTLSVVVASTTLNTGGITWNNIIFTPPSTPLQTITIPSNLIIGGNLTISGDLAGTSIVSTGGTLSISGDLIMSPISANGTTLTIPNAITVVNLSSIGAAGAGLNGFSVNVTGNFTTTRAIGGTTDINLIGTGTWSGSGAVIANLTFNSPSGTITLSGNLNYTTNSALITRTITYTAGTIITTGSTLTLNSGNASFTSIRLNTNTMVWNNINIPGINQIGAIHTITLLSNLYLSGTLYTIYPGPNGSGCAFSGAFTVYTGGLRVDFTLSGSPIVLNGTGIWQATYNLSSNLTINTSGTVTISGIVYYTTGTLTYTAGTVITTNSTLTLINNLTLNTNGIDWNNVTFSTSAVSCITTLSSDFNILGTTTFSAIGAIGLTFTAGTNRFNPTGPVVFSILTSGYAFGVTLPNDITIASLTYTSAFLNNTATFNTQTVKILGNININGPGLFTGTSTIELAGTGIWSHTSTGVIRNNLIINTGGTITISGNVYYNTNTLTYLKGNVNAKNAILNLSIASTLINLNKIAFGTVIITSGITIIMNQFFSGTQSYKTVVQPSSTTNYTITFQDNFEKFARNVKISRATLSRPDQLTVITDKGNNGNNIGVKFYPNQIPNGLAKNNPTVNPQSTYLAGGLVTDPCFV